MLENSPVTTHWCSFGVLALSMTCDGPSQGGNEKLSKISEASQLMKGWHNSVFKKPSTMHCYVSCKTSSNFVHIFMPHTLSALAYCRPARISGIYIHKYTEMQISTDFTKVRNPLVQPTSVCCFWQIPGTFMKRFNHAAGSKVFVSWVVIRVGLKVSGSSLCNLIKSRI